MDVRVAGSGHYTPRREVQVELTEVVLGRLHERDEPQQHRDVGECSGRHPAQPALRPDRAEQVVGPDSEHQGQEDHRPQLIQDAVVQRQLEHVERDVAPELRILYAEALAVRPQQDRLPCGAREEPGEEPDDERDPEPDAPRVGRDHLAVLVHGIVRCDRE